MSERKKWEVRSIHHPVITILAPDWLSALGAALTELGMDEGLDRLACERLSSGLIIANDVGRKQRFTIRDVTKRRPVSVRPRPRPRPTPLRVPVPGAARPSELRAAALRSPKPRAAAPIRESAERPCPKGPYMEWMLEGLTPAH